MTQKKQEYGQLREEILHSQKMINTLVLATTTASASLFIVGIQANNSTVASFAFLMPQIFVIFTLAHVRRKTRLMDRLACYIAVFHDMPNGGWELYTRFQFPNAKMNSRRVKGKWGVPKGLYTTYGFLSVILFTSAGLLISSKYFGTYGLVGLILPIITLAVHLYFDYKNKGWQHQCLVCWSDLKKIEEEKSPEWIYNTILNKE